MNEKKLKQLKKRLFIMGAYLIILGALLVYVSFSAYKIKINAKAIMPEALSFQAKISLDPGSVTHSAILSSSMYNIGPGDTLASKGDENYFTVTVDNHACIGTGSTMDVVSQMPLSYTLYVETLGSLPLEMKLSDGGIEYEASSAGTNRYCFKKDGKLLKISLSAIEAQNHTSEIHIGWKEYYAGQDTQDSKYMNELEVFMVEAELVPGVQEEVLDNSRELEITTYIPTDSAVTVPPE